MSCRLLSLFLFTAAVLLLNSPLLAAEDADKNSHEGTFVSAESDEAFTMSDKGKEHSHTLAAGAKVIGPDGKVTKLTALKKGQKIRVHTKEGDASIATKVEALKEK